MPLPSRSALLLVGSLPLFGCDSSQPAAATRGADPPAPSASARAAPSASAWAPLEVEKQVVELERGQSWVVVPRGARGPRPIVLFWDGWSDDARTACQALFDLAGQVPFVLCRRAPEGPTQPRIRDLKGSLRSLKQRFGAHVAGGSIVFLASGAVVEAGLSAIREEPAFFSRVALISEERIAWSATLASLFGRAGGQRVLMVCRAEACRGFTAHPMRWLERDGAEARVAEAGKASGSLGFGAGDWRWLVEGDARFALPSAP